MNFEMVLNVLMYYETNSRIMLNEMLSILEISESIFYGVPLDLLSKKCTTVAYRSDLLRDGFYVQEYVHQRSDDRLTVDR